MHKLIKRLKLKVYKLRTAWPRISKTAVIFRRRQLSIARGTSISHYCVINPGKSEIIIGEYCQINQFTSLIGGEGIEIGDFVMIAPGCVVVSGNHNYNATESPMRFSGFIKNGPIVIESDVWIGANCTITGGVTIGEGAVVGANSLVNKDIPKKAIAFGVPAKVIKYRE